jgi:hypothetical protein
MDTSRPVAARVQADEILRKKFKRRTKGRLPSTLPAPLVGKAPNCRGV